MDLSTASLALESGLIELNLDRTPVNDLHHLRYLDESEPSTSAALGHDVKNHGNYFYSTTLYVGSDR